jgi:hypothetical protein
MIQVRDVTLSHSASSFSSISKNCLRRSLLGLLDCEDEGSMIFQNVLTCSPNDLASHPVRLDSSWKTDISLLHFTKGEQHDFIKVWLNDVHCQMVSQHQAVWFPLFHRMPASSDE